MSLIRRVSGVLVILLSMLLLTTCAANPDAAGTGPANVAPNRAGGNPCASGSASSDAQAPIVCVDDSRRTLSVSPDPVRAHNVLRGDMRSPVTIEWRTRSGGGDLEIEIAPGCVTNLDCTRSGHCSARTVPGAKKNCKYDIWINGGNHDRLDPTVVVDDCCA